MTTVFADLALRLGGPPIGALLVKVTLALVLTLLVTHVARRSRAAVRHVMLAAEQPCRRQSGDAGADHGDAPPGRVSLMFV